MPTRPLFLLSLPRSGSTMLQRLLAAHPDVATVSEGWLLLPLLYSLRPGGVAAEYEHSSAARAIGELADSLGGGRDEYLARVRELALRVYESAASSRAFFLDKTPRYHFVVDTLFELFPDAAFVFLWRSPPAVVASMVDNAGHWNLDQWQIDLYRGLESLTAARAAHPEALSVRYEDLVADPERELGRVFDRLGLAPAPAQLAPVEGSFGDRRGTAVYDAVSREPLEKWRRTLATPLRKRWTLGYLDWIGRERLALMGYDLDELRREVESLPSRPGSLVSDARWMAYARYRRARVPRPSWRVV